jgi:hypothetical protein
MIRGSLADGIADFRRTSSAYMREEAEELREEMRVQIRRRTPIGSRIDVNTGVDLGPSGALRRSVNDMPIRRVGADTWRGGVESRLDYASHVEYGTRRHIIEGNRYLRFWVGRRMVIRRRVQHPGMDGAFMFLEGSRVAEARWETAANRRLSRELRVI